MNYLQFRETLLIWYENHKRNLPWRVNKNIYSVWLSEVMLQQTRVETAIPYYDRFIKKIPNLEELASANEDTILKLWEGLGYYQRVRNFQKAAKIVFAQYNGNIPTEGDQFIQLPGVGPYIGAAVLSIADNQPYAAVDGNIKRVISRLFCYDKPLSKVSGFQEIADRLLDKNDPGEFNQAMMELGATICQAKNPQCANCPVATFCLALEQNRVTDFPVRIPRKKNPVVYRTAYIPENFPQQLWLCKRTAPGLLSGLWEIPMTTAESHQQKEFTIKHVYSHFTEYVNIEYCHKLPKGLGNRNLISVINKNESEDYALTGVTQKIISSLSYKNEINGEKELNMVAEN